MTHREQQRRTRARNRMHVLNIKMSRCCADCGLRIGDRLRNGTTAMPSHFEFDHLPGFKKKMDITLMTGRSFSIKTIDAEIAKCHMVCCMCHRTRTFSGVRRPKYLK